MFLKDLYKELKEGVAFSRRLRNLETGPLQRKNNMYTKAGGKGTNVCIYYSPPGQTLDNGIKLLEGDAGIRELLRDYKGLNVIHLYVVENSGPIIAVDALGNIIEDNVPMPQLTYKGDTGLMEAEGVNEGVDEEIGVGAEVRMLMRSLGWGLRLRVLMREWVRSLGWGLRLRVLLRVLMREWMRSLGWELRVRVLMRSLGWGLRLRVLMREWVKSLGWGLRLGLGLNVRLMKILRKIGSLRLMDLLKVMIPVHQLQNVHHGC
ncbi:UNVERIFIED_CONTAM: hypothetical protein Sradi_0162300 [Sesamum radiatum]|uniref:Uncharacterized protein n=1 Tax=Sesamum radiatum TaxID=300843 RepID=A0AAW2WK27_SESRA